MHAQHSQDLDGISKAIPKLRRLTQVGGTIEHARSVGIRLLAEAVQLRGMLRGIKESIETQYAHTFERWYSRRPAAARPYALHYETVGARWMRVGGYALVAIEAILTAWLSRLFLALPGWLAVGVGVALAIFLGFGAKGVKAFLIARYADTPIEARDLLVRWIVISSILEAVLVIVLLYVRGSTDSFAARVAIAFGGISALMSFNTMWLAGAMLACAELYSFSSQLATLWERADSLERQILILEQVTEYRMDALGPSDRGHDEGRRMRTKSREPVSLFDRRSLGPTARAVVRGAVLVAVFATALSAQRSCRVWRDDSTSPLGPELVVMSREIVRAAPQVTTRSCGGSWQVTGFSDDAWSVTPRATVAWPVSDTVTCATPRLNEAESLFTNARERRLAEARHLCDSRRAAAATRLGAAEARAAEQLRDALLAPPTRRGTCTAVNDLLQRIVTHSAPGVDIIGSDMVESCAAGLRPLPAPHGTRVIVVLVSRVANGTNSRAEDYERRRERVLRAAPWAEVLPPWALADALLGLADGAVSTAAQSPR